ncbi:MAG: LacI family DNA-binding transcriptional regulator [Roseiflexaceae bacterium]
MTTLADKQSQPHRLPTMREVAALAGVSIKTVSRVINQEAGVSPELIERVNEAIRLLDYQHNSAASSLRRNDQRTATIGLVLDDVANPFSSALHRAVEEVARQHHTLVLAASSDDEPERMAEVLHTLASRRIDGLIIVPSGSEQAGLQQLQRLGRPIVCVDRPAALAEVDSVTVDNRAGASAAVRHLAAHGHRQIGFLGDRRSIWTAAERHLGYVEGLALAGLRLDTALVRQDIGSSDSAARAVAELLAADDPPTALFTGQNLITIGAIRTLQQQGLQRRVALVGFDDVLLADLLDPPVSVVAQDLAALGRSAAELLFARLGGDASPPQHIIVPTRLIARGSGEIRA